MMGRSRANEIPELVRQLGSRSRTRVDAAKARLSVIGERAVEALIHALEGDDNRIRAHAMPLLAVIQDTRAREPLTAMLLDRNVRLREIAARSLGRFPCQHSVRALKRALDRENDPRVKVAVVRALADHAIAGREDALGQLLRVLFDTEESVRARTATLAVLRALPAGERRGILSRLQQDPVDPVRERAHELARSIEESTGPAASEISRLIDDLASDDYTVWNDAVYRLGSHGAAVVRPLVDRMIDKAHDPEYCTRAGMALKALGPRRARSLADALERVDEALPLQVLVEVVGSTGEKSMIYRLADVIERVGALPPGRTRPGEVDPFQRVRAKAHLELARVGSRVAIQDLRDALSDSSQRVELELLAAVELVGKPEELPILLRAYCREDEFVAGRIASAVREIMKRERIRRNAKLLGNLPPELRQALDRIVAPAPRGRARRGTARQPRLGPERRPPS